MTNTRKNKIIKLAYDLAFELESINANDWDHIIDNGGTVDSLQSDVDKFRNAISTLKTT